MSEERMSLQFTSSFTDVVDLNPNFAIAKMWVAYHGKNRNMSEISKQVFIDAVPTAAYCPVVGRYDRESNDFGGHDIEVLIKDNYLDFVNLTTPFGVVPENAKWGFETIVDASGNEHEYFTISVILWKRQEGYERLIELKSISQSMEIDMVRGHLSDDGYTVVDEMRYSAFCILGSNHEPCFEGARIEIQDENDPMRGDKYAAMMSELKEFELDIPKQYCLECEPEEEPEQVQEQEPEQEVGGEHEQTDAGEEGQSQETVEEQGGEPEPEEGDGCDECAVGGFGRFTAVYIALPSASFDEDSRIATSWTLVCIEDGDIAVVAQNEFAEESHSTHVYRVPFSITEGSDKIEAVFDFDSKELVIANYYTQAEADHIREMQDNYDALVEYRATRERQDHEAEIDAVLDRFSNSIGDIEEFATLRDGAYAMNASDVEMRCYAILGKHGINSIESEDSSSLKIPVKFSNKHEETPEDENDRYNGLFQKYNKK